MAYSKVTIESVQQAVNAAGYTPALVVDGIIGPKTTAGVAWLQQTSSYTRTDGVLDDQFLANLGIDPTATTPGYAGAAATTVTQGQAAPQPVYVPPPLPLNVKPPPAPAPYVPPAPKPSPSPSPVAAKTSPIPAAVGGAAGAGLGWFAVGGPLAAAIGAAVGGIGGYLFGKKTSSASMGCEPTMSAETTPAPTQRYFTATCAQLARQPAAYYRYAPRAIISALSAWCASMMASPAAMAAPVYKLGRWEARRVGQNITLYGPPFHEAGAMFGAEHGAVFGAGKHGAHPAHAKRAGHR